MLKVMTRHPLEICGFDSWNYMKKLQCGGCGRQMYGSVTHLQCFIVGVRALAVFLPSGTR